MNTYKSIVMDGGGGSLTAIREVLQGKEEYQIAY